MPKYPALSPPCQGISVGIDRMVILAYLWRDEGRTDGSLRPGGCAGGSSRQRGNRTIRMSRKMDSDALAMILLLFGLAAALSLIVFLAGWAFL